MKKYQVFTILAILLLTFSFTIPTLGFHGVINKIKSHNSEAIPSYAYPTWDFYHKFQYQSPYTPKGAEGSLKEMIKRNGEIGVASIPIWKVSLEAPNYPKDAFPHGIPVYFHLEGNSGDVEEMNTINHYIGMYPMERGGQIERAAMPYFLLVLTLMMIGFLYVNHKLSWILMIAPIIFPIVFVADFSAWLYWYGHNMQDWGAFEIKPFMPTVFGQGKVAQFTTHSYPTVGFYILIIISVLSILSIFSKLKEQKNSEK